MYQAIEAIRETHGECLYHEERARRMLMAIKPDSMMDLEHGESPDLANADQSLGVEAERNLALMRSYRSDYSARYPRLFDTLYLLVTQTVIVELDVHSGHFTEYRLSSTEAEAIAQQALFSTYQVLI